MATEEQNPDATDDPVTGPAPTDDSEPTSTDVDGTPLADQTKSGDLPKWLYSVPPDLRDSEALKGFSTIGEAAQALIDLKGRSERTVEVPGEGAAPEDVHAFYRKLGRPDGPEGYEVTKPTTWPEGAPWDDSLAKRFAGNAHRAGLSKRQAQVMYELDTAHAGEIWKQSLGAKQKQVEQWQAQLLDQVGGDEVKLAELMAASKRALRLVGSPELEQLYDKLGIASNPLVVNSYVRAGKAFAEDEHVTGGLQRGRAMAEDQRRITDFYAKKSS